MVYERPASRPTPQRQDQPPRQREVKKPPAPARQRSSVPGPSVGPKLQPLADEVGEIARKGPPRLNTCGEGLSPRDAAPTAPPAAAILDLDDPDALRRAILHYEILGKPIALRDLSG